jgi:hypothetical protein
MSTSNYGNLGQIILVCVIHCHEGHVWIKQCQELNCMVGPPFKIGKYYTKVEQEQCLIMLL